MPATRTRRVGGRPWRRLVALVLARDNYVCQLRLSCCTGTATTGDHIIPIADRPDLELDPGNVRASCVPCNLRRGRRPLVRPGPMPSPRWKAIR